MPNVIMLFIDGIGFGKENCDNNPFFKYKFKFFTDIVGVTPSLSNMYRQNNGTYLFPTDPLMGVEGLPQSGTGQTAIFCGMNAAKYVGKHFGPFPYSTLIPIIKENNIFADLLRLNKKVAFVNAYPKVFFDYIKSGKGRLSVSTLSATLSGLKLRKTTDVRRGKGITAEITNARWNSKLGYKLPIITPETAANRLLKVAKENDFTLFEYFLTDHIGHGRYDEDIETCINNLDRFITAIHNGIDKTDTTLFICSDHGNFEDLSIKTHTKNPCITVSAGRLAGQLKDNIKSLPDIKNAIISLTE